ncbi:MAG: ATP-binding protein [Agriterribacter sp.]
MAKKLQSIPKEFILNRLKFENPWWETGDIEKEYGVLKKRLYFELLFTLVEEVDVKRAVVLMGPRRVGKTVIMHHVIDGLLKRNKVRSNKICFINIENPLYVNIGLQELFLMAMKSVENEDPDGWFVFFDEIQYLKEWEIHLKVLVDSYPNTKFIVSGSAAAALKIKSNESGAGRFTDFMLPPLTFHEYIHLKDHENLITRTHIFFQGKKLDFFGTNNVESLNNHFVEYINYGGYPEVIFSSKIQSDLSRYIKNDIIDKVLLRDLPSLYGIQNVQELNAFFTTLVFHSGNELSVDSLSVASGVNKNTLKKYLEYLEAAFLIKRIHRIDEAGNKFQRQGLYKIYLTNPSLRSALFSPLEPTDDRFGNMVETAIFSQWLHRDNYIPWYARWQSGEIDMVGLGSKTLKPIWAVEIKWGNKLYDNLRELKNMFTFCNKNSLKDAVVTTRDKFEYKTIDGLNINYIPCSVYAYNAGYNTIAHQYVKMI